MIKNILEDNQMITKKNFNKILMDRNQSQAVNKLSKVTKYKISKTSL